MSTIQALIIGIIQGLTEFFPVSSSAHMKLTKIFLNVPEGSNQVIFDLMCHLGTLMAVLYFLRRDIIEMLRSDRRKFLLLFIATLPLIPCYFLLKPLRELASQEQFLGLTLTITALILFLAQSVRLKREPVDTFKRKVSDVLWIGALQSAALIPGISRSASTISCAHVLGWSAKDAVRFSFLLSIPTIIGGNAIELLRMATSSGVQPEISSCLIGFLSSLGIGLIAIRYALRWLEKGILRPFAWYCLALGAAATIYLNYFYG